MTHAATRDPIDMMQEAWDFAAQIHNGQTVPGSDLPYLKHVGAVALELLAVHGFVPVPDLWLALPCAILHDSIEDQGLDLTDLTRRFGPDVAMGVQALSKDPTLPKAEAMRDSLQRIRQRPMAIWCVKLADRIVNLRGAPPHWKPTKIAAYREEAKLILETLRPAHTKLAERLEDKIRHYPD